MAWAVALAFGKEGPLDLAQHLAPMVQTSESTPTRGRTFQDAKRDMLSRFETVCLDFRRDEVRFRLPVKA